MEDETGGEHGWTESGFWYRRFQKEYQVNCNDNSNIEKIKKNNSDKKEPNLEKDNINLIINKEDKANVDKSQELNKDSKYVSLSLQIEELKKPSSEMMKQIEVLKKKNEQLTKEVESLKIEERKKECELKNRIDILETKINMNCHREILKI